MLKASLNATGNRYGQMRYTADKIGGAIQWIDNPFNVAFKVSADAALFAEEAMVGKGFLNMVDNGLFRTLVDFGDKVVTTFLIHLNRVETVCRFYNHFAGQTGSAKGNINHWLHIRFSN